MQYPTYPLMKHNTPARVNPLADSHYYRSAKTIGVIVARYQTSMLTDGHLAVINHVNEESDLVVFVLGTSHGNINDKHPLPFKARRDMLWDELECVTSEDHVIELHDHKEDDVWVNKLDELLDTFSEGKKVILYGCRDSFVTTYRKHSGRYVSELLTDIEVEGVSATNSRIEDGKVIVDDPNWRAGVIWATQNKFPTSYQAVDNAIVREHEGVMQVLLGRKPNESLFRFPGGFVDPKDQSLKDAAIREVHEECGDIEITDCKYIDSFRIDDWRYRGTKDATMTALHISKYISGDAKAGDDLEEVQWMNIGTVFMKPDAVLIHEHIALFYALRKFIADNPFYLR